MSKSTLASRLISVFPSFVRLGRAVGFTISVFSPFLAPPIVISTFVMASSSVSPAWRASGSGFSFNSSSSFATSFDVGSACVSVFSTLAASVSSTFSSSTIASLSSSDFNASLFSSAFGVVSSVLFSFSAAGASILASACSSFVSSFSETSSAGAFSASTTGVLAIAGSDFSSAAGALATASFTSASATSKFPTASVSFSVSLFSTFVASTESWFSLVAAGSELSLDSVSPPLVSALASTLVDVDSLPSPTCALTTVGEKNMQYPNTQDTNPTDSFLVPYLGLLLADFSFFFSINSLNFSKILPPLIYTIYLLECNKNAKAPK